MRVAFRFFAVFLLIEMMCLYHCFGTNVHQINYLKESTLRSDIAQVNPIEDTIFNSLELLEGKSSNESSEEDNDDSNHLSHTAAVRLDIITFFSLKNYASFNRLLDFKENRSHLFVLFHSWKYHLA